MSTTPELEELLRVLGNHGIDLGRDDVAWAFESSKMKDQIVSWVQEHLSPCTLLTREEANFAARGLSAEPNVTVGPVISDEDFEVAIGSLEASTASIEKQCKLLEAQKRALQEIQARNCSSSADGIRAQRSSKFNREKAQADFEAADLGGSLQSKIGRSLKQSENAMEDIHASIERVLEKDDRILDGLQKVLVQLSGATTDTSISEEIERLCQVLIAYSSAEIHAKTDSAYQSASKAKTDHAEIAHSPNSTKQRESLKAELEELCKEIDGLSTMAVDSQFRNPISKALGTAASDSKNDKAEWLDYMSTSLHYLTQRLTHLEDGTQQLRSQNRALKTVSSTLNSVLRVAVDNKQHIQTRMQSPHKASQKGLKPLRLVQANLSESQDPAAQLLRQLDVRATDSRDLTQLSENLESAVQEKYANLVSLSARTERNVSEQISRSIASADENVLALISAVYAYSPFGTVSLVDNSITEGIGQLEQRTQSLSDEMRELDMDQIREVVKEKHRALLNLE